MSKPMTTEQEQFLAAIDNLHPEIWDAYFTGQINDDDLKNYALITLSNNEQTLQD